MARRIRVLLAIAGAFMLTTAGSCPELCELDPRLCENGIVTSKDTEAEPAPADPVAPADGAQQVAAAAEAASGT